MIGTDANYNISYWNKGAKKMFGFTETEAIGKTSQKLLRLSYAPGEREKILEELNLKGSSEVIINTKHRNGTEIIVEANSTRIIDEYGNISGYVVVYHDITKQKQNEHKIQDHLENEQQLTEELQTSNEELQAVTEELQVSNEELQQQRNELANVNDALLDSERRMNISQEIAHLGGWELDIENDSLPGQMKYIESLGFSHRNSMQLMRLSLIMFIRTIEQQLMKHIQDLYVRVETPMKLSTGL